MHFVKTNVLNCRNFNDYFPPFDFRSIKEKGSQYDFHFVCVIKLDGG